MDTRQKLFSLQVLNHDLSHSISTSLALRGRQVVAHPEMLKAVEEDIDACIRDLARARGFDLNPTPLKVVSLASILREREAEEEQDGTL